jgi:hypothetical protein
MSAGSRRPSASTTTWVRNGTQPTVGSRPMFAHVTRSEIRAIRAKIAQ